MTTQCPKCKSENPDESKFCNECGLQIDSIDKMPAPPTQTLEAPREELTMGSTFAGRYQIIEELGKGGMGKVYRALDKKLNEEVALKLIKPEIASDKKTLERFQNELKLARKISHRNVGRMYELLEDKSTSYITMEYVSGQDLKSLIRQTGQLAIPTALSIAKQICEGLSEAHQLGIIHRDLKPSNILIDKEGNARIMDFGIARSVEGKGITGAGVMIGTPEYMPPEQAEAKEVDQRSDIYSLGIILYEMVTGRVPFEGDTALSIAMKHKGEEPKDPREFNSQISGDLSRVILRCLEKEKDKRYQSAGELGSELENMEKGIPTTERVIPAKKPLTSREITVQLNPKKILIPAIAFIALIIAGVTIWQFLFQKDVTPIPSDKPSIAIMYFKNNTGDDGLDHWRTMLSNLLVADLTQSKYVRVLGEDKLFDILTQLDQAEATTYSSAVLEQVASQGGVSHILQGAYAKAGDEFRINVMLQEGKTGELISSESVSGEGEESIFSMVDELTRRIKADLKLSEEKISDDIDDTVGTITTSSPEAYKFYIEANKQVEYRKAIEYYEKAISIDSEFATAYKSMAMMYFNLDLYSEYKKNLEIAMKLKSRTSERERYRIEAEYYWISEKTQDKALEAYYKILDLYPHDGSASQNLAISLTEIGRWDEAIEMWEDTRRSKRADFLTYLGLAYFYTRKGLYEKAKEVMQECIMNYPENFRSHLGMAIVHRDSGDFDQALLDMEKAFALNPTHPDYYVNYGSIYRCMEDFNRAEEQYRKLIDRDDDYDKSQGLRQLAILYISQARFEESRRLMEGLIAITKEIKQPVWETAQNLFLGWILLKSGEHEQALKHFDTGWKMAVEGEEFGQQRTALMGKGVVYVEMDAIDNAQKIAEELKILCQQSINKTQAKKYHYLSGMIDLKKKNYSSAVESLEKAVSLDPDICKDYMDSLAYAYFEWGELDKAKSVYEEILSRPRGMLEYGYEFIRSHYMLGKIYEQQGDTAKAIEHYEKFLDLWINADSGIAEVEDAKERLAGLRE